MQVATGAEQAKIKLGDLWRETVWIIEIMCISMTVLARQLVLTIDSPVWESVRTLAPWVRRKPLSGGQRKSGERPAMDGGAGADLSLGVAPGTAMPATEKEA